ncbi:MAG: hypothetical protein SFT92_10110 [Rickettsiales bacterium]|nr:hypothetical protein [Rickettsiales bacterium]
MGSYYISCGDGEESAVRINSDDILYTSYSPGEYSGRVAKWHIKLKDNKEYNFESRGMGIVDLSNSAWQTLDNAGFLRVGSEFSVNPKNIEYASARKSDHDLKIRFKGGYELEFDPRMSCEPIGKFLDKYAELSTGGHRDRSDRSNWFEERVTYPSSQGESKYLHITRRDPLKPDGTGHSICGDKPIDGS